MAGGAKIAIWDLVAESYRFVLSHPRELVRVGWAPLLILFTANILFGAYAPGAESVNLFAEIFRISGNLTIQTVVAAAVLVGWHRFVLLGEEARPGGSFAAIGRRELRYLAAWVGLSVLFLVLFIAAWAFVLVLFFFAMAIIKLVLLLAGSGGAIPLGETNQFVVLELAAIPAAMLIAAYVAIRLSLILPAMAVDRDRAMRRAWGISSGQGWRLVLASFFTLIPAEIISIGVALGARTAYDTALFVPLALVAAAGLVLLIVVTGTVLSLFSRDLDTADAYAGSGAALGAGLDAGPSASPA